MIRSHHLFLIRFVVHLIRIIISDLDPRILANAQLGVVVADGELFQTQINHRLRFHIFDLEKAVDMASGAASGAALIAQLHTLRILYDESRRVLVRVGFVADFSIKNRNKKIDKKISLIIVIKFYSICESTE